MEKLLSIISREIGDAFEACGYERELGRVTVSNRPDLCEYQCNGAMAGAKKYHKAPFMIADEVAEKLQSSKVVKDVASVKPGFLNFNLIMNTWHLILTDEDQVRSMELSCQHQRRL